MDDCVWWSEGIAAVGKLVTGAFSITGAALGFVFGRASSGQSQRQGGTRRQPISFAVNASVRDTHRSAAPPFASVSAPQQCKVLTVGGMVESAKLAVDDEGRWFAKSPCFYEVATFSFDKYT